MFYFELFKTGYTIQLCLLKLLKQTAYERLNSN